MLAEQQTSSILLKFGKDHKDLNRIFNFELKFGEAKINGIKSQIQSLAGKAFNFSSCIYVTKYQGETRFGMAVGLEVVVHKNNGNLFLVIQPPGIQQLLEQLDLKGIEDKQSCLMGSFQIDGNTDIIQQGMSIFNNAVFHLSFNKSDAVCMVLQRVSKMIAPQSADKIMSMYKLFKQLNLQLNCSSSSSLSSSILQRINNSLFSQFNWNVLNNIDKTGKAYFSAGKIGLVQFDINNKYFARVLQIIGLLFK